jgi:Rrf2 family protein
LLPHTFSTLTRTTPGVSRYAGTALGKADRSCNLPGYDTNEANETVRRDVKEHEGLRLELSSEGRYALRALLYLAWTEERVPAQRISAEAHIPRRLLARILARLSRAGLVESEQGRNGGSKLARLAGRITLREAVEAVEGPFGVTSCIMSDRICGQGSPCALHEAWEKGQQTILDYLATQTLEDFLTQNPSVQLPPRT